MGSHVATMFTLHCMCTVTTGIVFMFWLTKLIAPAIGYFIYHLTHFWLDETLFDISYDDSENTFEATNSVSIFSCTHRVLLTIASWLETKLFIQLWSPFYLNMCVGCGLIKYLRIGFQLQKKTQANYSRARESKLHLIYFFHWFFTQIYGI